MAILWYSMTVLLHTNSVLNLNFVSGCSSRCQIVPVVLQVIGLLKDAFQKAGLDLYLAPYGVLPTAYECGIIEVVPEASSRSALGETSDAGLYEIFQREFGAPGTDSFEVARHNFILSSAG